MLILLPILTFLVAFVSLTGYNERRNDIAIDWRYSFLQAAVALGGYMVIFSEILSLFNALAIPAIATFWGIALLAALLFGLRQGLLIKGQKVLWQQIRSFRWVDISLAIFLGVILLALFVVAVKSPPNNTDSLQYHMSRVMHWAQDQSLRFFPTAYDNLLANPIFAELSILNLRSLWGNDQVAALVQWFSMLGALIGVSVVARVLGASRLGQWAAVAFAASIPMGILQASSTQNDYVVAFLLISALYFVALAWKQKLTALDSISLGCAVGLGMLTKGTAYPYFLPVVVWFVIIQVKKSKLRQVILQGALITIIVLILNAGYWARNIIAYGGPLGPSDWISGVAATSYSPGVYISSLVGNILLNFSTPTSLINPAIINWYKTTFSSLDPNASAFNLTWGWNHADFAGSPLQALLFPVTLGLLIIFRKRVKEAILKWYILAILGAILILVLVIQFNVYVLRLDLPFGIAFAPVFGVALTLIKVDKLVEVFAIGLLLTMLPYVIFNRARPLIAMRTTPQPFSIPCYLGCTSGSILTESPKTVLFAFWIEFRDAYSNAANLVLASGCRNVGLSLDSHDIEYVFWWLLNAPQSGIRLEAIDPPIRLQRYVDPNFKPCAIICTLCNKIPRFHNLDLSGDFTTVRVYLGDNYNAQPTK